MRAGPVSEDGTVWNFAVPREFDGERLDRVLTELFSRSKGPDRTRSWVQQAIRDGRVLVSGERAELPRARVVSGDKLLVEPPAELEQASLEGAPELRIVHEDEFILVVDKPAGLLTHRASARPVATLADLVAQYAGPLPSIQSDAQRGAASDERPGIAHRLDADTSGLLALGKTEQALAGLVDAFRERNVEKRYVALVQGEPRFDTQWIDTPIERSPRHPDRMRIAAEGQGRAAETYYEVRVRRQGFARLDCFPKTGRTHQIRVHLGSIGHPLIADRIYRGPGGRTVLLPSAAPPMERHALHAAELAFAHPVTGEPLRFTAELPPDMAALAAWIDAAVEATE